jgi:type I restriction enzyme S subunit
MIGLLDRAGNELNTADSVFAYQSYKASGLEWIGRIPQHWSVLPNRALFKELKERNCPDAEMLSVTITRGVIPQKVLLAGSSKRDSSKTDKSAYKLVCQDDLAYNKMRAWQGAIGVSRFRGIVSPAYIVMRLRTDKHVPVYFHYLYRTPHFAKEAERWSYGIASDMWSLRPENFKLIYSPIPSYDEQAAIVRYLNYWTTIIDRAVQAKRSVISLLNEQRRIIIDRAVLHGIRNDVPFNSAGNEWIGNVPSHWTRWRTKDLYREVDERSATGSEELLSVSHLTGITPRSEKNVTMFKAASYVGQKTCRPSDLVINTMWAWMGALGVSRYAGIVSSAYGVYRPKKNCGLTDEYADHLFRARPYISEYICRSTGIRSSRLRLYPEQFLRIPVFVPPREEQHNIVEFISRETRQINETIGSAEREISLLREYCTRLISDVVTGKLDVCAAAKLLPENSGELMDLGSADEYGAIEEEEAAFAEAADG